MANVVENVFKFQFLGHLGGGIRECLWEGMGARVATVQCDHIDIVGIAGGDFLSQQGAPTGDDERIGSPDLLEQRAEESQCLMQGIFRKLTHKVVRIYPYSD